MNERRAVQDFYLESSTVLRKIEVRNKEGNFKLGDITAQEYKVVQHLDRKKHYARLFYTLKYQSTVNERKQLALTDPSMFMTLDPSRSFELRDFKPADADATRQFMTLWNKTVLKLSH